MATANTDILHQLAGDHDRFAVLDTETTGFSSLYDDVIEVAIQTLDLDGNPVELWSSLVKPNRRITNSYIHHITDDMVANAPSFADISAEILKKLENARIVGHYVSFDLRMLGASFGFGKIGESASVEGGEDDESNEVVIRTTPPPWEAYLDTRQISRKTLEEACSEFGIASSVYHRAEADVIATSQLFLKHPERCSLLPKARQAYLRQLERENNDDEWRDIVESFDADCLAGKKIVITGALKFVRRKAQSLIVQAGGEMKENITKETDFLVVGDTGWHGETTKVKKARSLGIQVVSGEDFIRDLLDDSIP